MAVAVFFVIRFSMAAYVFNDAETIFKNALQLEQSEKSQAYLQALERVDKALKLRSKQAKALDLKGEILYRQWWVKPDGEYLGNSSLLQESKIFHEKALAIRQEWPFTMLQLTRLEAHKARLGDDFYKRFNQTYEFGRFEVVIALDLMNLGLLRWNELNKEAKKKVIELTNLSVQQKRNSLNGVRDSLKKMGLYLFMCSRIEQNDRQADLCN